MVSGDLQDRTAVDLDGHGERCEVRASSFAFVSRFEAPGSVAVPMMATIDEDEQEDMHEEG